MGTPRRRRVFLVLPFLLSFIALALALPASAQPAPAPPAAEAEASAAPAAAAEAAAEKSAPALDPALSDPAIDRDDLELRLIPLTRDDLASLAATWLDIARSKTQEVVEAQLALRRAEGAAADEERTRLDALSRERRDLFDKYATVVTAWERKGGDAAEIATYRAYQSAVIIEETRTAGWRNLVGRAFGWLTERDGGVELGVRTTTVILALIALFTVAGVVRRVAGRGVARVPNLSKLLQAFILMVIYWLTIAFGLMIVLSMLGVDITPVFALIGGASFIMAFALQDTLGNLAAGLMIMVNRPFDEGDYVDIGGVAGTVKSVSIVSTKVTTPDNQVIVVPNSKVWGNVITNVTASPTRRVDLTFGVSYDDDVEKVQEVLEKTVHAHPLVLREPEPVVRVNELGPSSINFVVRPWARGDDYWAVYWDLLRQVKAAFDAAGISIPYPQQEMHLRVPADAPAALAGTAPGRRRAARPKGRPAGARDYASGDEGFDADEEENS